METRNGIYVDARLTELQLCMPGVAPARAKRVAWRPLERLTL